MPIYQTGNGRPQGFQEDMYDAVSVAAFGGVVLQLPRGAGRGVVVIIITLSMNCPQVDSA